jgi:hypothetical protein
LSNGSRPKFDARAEVAVPAEIYEWKASPATRAKAAETQGRIRAELQKAISEGLTVLGYERDGKGNGKFLLGAWEESLQY